MNDDIKYIYNVLITAIFLLFLNMATGNSESRILLPSSTAIFNKYDNHIYISNSFFKRSIFSKYGIFQLDEDAGTIVPIFTTFWDIDDFLIDENLIIYEEWDTPMSVNICSFNIETNRKNRILSNVYSLEAIYNHVIYYVNDRTLYQYEMITKRKQELFHFSVLSSYKNGFLYTISEASKDYEYYYDIPTNSHNRTFVPIDYSSYFIGPFGVQKYNGTVFNVEGEIIADLSNPSVQNYILTDKYIFYYDSSKEKIVIHRLPSLEVAAEINVSYEHFYSFICDDKLFVIQKNNRSTIDLINIQSCDAKIITTPWYSR